MEPITSIASTAVKITSEISKGAVKEVAKKSATSLKTCVLNKKVVSPTKTSKITDSIKTRINHKELTDPSISVSIQKPSEGVYTNGNKITYKFNKDLLVKDNKIYFQGQEFATINEKTRTISIDREKGLNSGGINTFLSHTTLSPNTSYDVIHGLNRTVYTTDGIGRCKTIQNIAVEPQKLRSRTEQVKALRTKNEQTLPNTDRRINDQSGHYIASRNGGIPESINLFPQAHNLNNSKAFMEMEKTINSALDSGSSVKTNIDINYKGLSHRPDSLTYKVQIDGGKIMEFNYENINLTQNEISSIT